MKNQLQSLIVALSVFCIPVSAIASSQDTGKVKQFYATASGTVAIMLDGGFPNAVASGQCPNANVWTGNTSADPLLKSALLAAKTSQQPVTVVVNGCEMGGSWFKVTDVYIQ